MPTPLVHEGTVGAKREMSALEVDVAIDQHHSRALYTWSVIPCLYDGGVTDACKFSGDKISGTVSTNLQTSTRVRRLTINFKCKLKTVIVTGAGDSRRVHRCKALLFFYTRTLFQSPLGSTVLQGQETYPFQFQFPWEVVRVPGQSFEPHANFNHLPDHLLPPTFTTSQGKLLQSSNVQSVEYYLEAILEKDKMFASKTKARTVLLFSPSRPVMQPNVELVMRSSIHERSTRKLNPLFKDEHRSIKDKTKKLFGAGGPEPTALFSVDSTVPSVAYVNGPLPISLGVRHDTARSTATTVPDVILKNVYARLTCTITYRVPYQGMLFISSGNYIRSSSEKIDVCRSAPLSISSTESMDLNEFVPGLRIPAQLSPTFKTYTLSCHYVLKVSVSLVCLGKEYVVDIGKCPLFMYPSIFRDPPASIDRLHASAEDEVQQVRIGQAWDAPPEEELPPPAYHNIEVVAGNGVGA